MRPSMIQTTPAMSSCRPTKNPIATPLTGMPDQSQPPRMIITMPNTMVSTLFSVSGTSALKIRRTPSTIRKSATTIVRATAPASGSAITLKPTMM